MFERGLSEGRKMKIAVIDGMGGGIGSQIIASLKKEIQEDITILALDTNAIATNNMIKAGAEKGATGENAIKVTAADVDLIIGPLGIIIPNSMLGEITPAMAEYISNSPALKIVLPVNQSHVEIAGYESKPLNQLIKAALNRVKELVVQK